MKNINIIKFRRNKKEKKIKETNEYLKRECMYIITLRVSLLNIKTKKY